MAPILGYWDVRGIVQPIRMLLEYTGTRYEEKLYVCGPAPSYDKSCWLNEKDSLGLDFPNVSATLDTSGVILPNNLAAVFTSQLPYLPHSCRIYLTAAVFTSQLPYLPLSCRINLTAPVFTSQLPYLPHSSRIYLTAPESDKAAYLAGLPAKWKSLSDFLGSRKWLAGDNDNYDEIININIVIWYVYLQLTYPDLIAYELLYQHQALAPGCLQDFPLLQDLMRRVEGLKGIKEFLQTPKCKDMPFNNPSGVILMHHDVGAINDAHCISS
ncbi:hypothetical protein HAZT_HAZT000373 [Hyalella azteca]|uniref:glutathione transferase n=1 Tax=Hyalella azteca TaxID=294128 RepID=A0A6A0H6L9_HYAAZ|nr:hypothetical protein HAZT_HAZT000373 [Hyalella azteca]